MEKYILQDWGADVQFVIDKVQALVEQGGDDAILLTKADKEKLDKLGVHCHRTAYWEAMPSYVPKKGEIIIYSDYKKIDREGESVLVPGIKIGSGNAYVSDLAFIDEAEQKELADHMADLAAHVSEKDRQFWDNKLNVEEEIEEETLVFNRL